VSATITGACCADADKLEELHRCILQEESGAASGPVEYSEVRCSQLYMLCVISAVGGGGGGRWRNAC